MDEAVASQNGEALQALQRWCAGERCTQEWIEIDQPRIDAFAQATGDRYWLHTDPQRAKHESTFGNTIAHGFLILSLVVGDDVVEITRIPGIAYVLNYGLDRVRFLAPVVCGARLRVHTVTGSLVEKDPGRWLLRQTKSVQMQGRALPVLVAEQLVLIMLTDPA
jgi:acyl dehydratase